MMRLVIFVCCFNSIILCFSPIVRVEEGELVGTSYELPNGRIVDAFLGVPYAAPPIFERRFEEPQKLNSWKDVWNATKFSSHCLQIEPLKPYSISGDEDCLYLNIYTPKLPVDGDASLMDVMVFIHSGAFITDDNVAPGNYGLKDQVAALKWIQRNVIHFGGNPSSVTIVGLSAGGASVHYHFVSPMSEGLFQKGVSVGGTLLPPWTLPRNVTQKSTHLANLVGCPTNSTKDMVTCLRSRPARAITEQMRNFMVWRFCPFTPFGPTVEPDSPNAFLSTHPLDLLKNGKVKNLPWMTSVTEKEGLYPGSEYIPYDAVLKELDEKWHEISPNLLMYNYSVPEQEKI